MSDEKKERTKLKTVGRIILYLFDTVVDMAVFNAKIIKRNISLFFGLAMSIFGLLSFKSDKYCDGNTANYLSCTRPTTYYYYDWLSIIIIIVGVFFVTLWLLKSRTKN